MNVTRCLNHLTWGGTFTRSSRRLLMISRLWCFQQPSARESALFARNLCKILWKFILTTRPSWPLHGLVQHYIKLSSTRKENALVSSFVHSPVGDDVDWRLSTTISPCHATVLVENYDHFLEFVQRSKMVGPSTSKMQWLVRRVKYWLLSVHSSKSVPLGWV